MSLSAVTLILPRPLTPLRLMMIPSFFIVMLASPVLAR